MIAVAKQCIENIDVTEPAAFPEDAFSPERRSSRYWELVARGRRRMRSTSVAICGLARSIAGVLPRTMARIERVGEMFGDYRVIIVENDSCDTTPAQLIEWSKENWRVDIISFNRQLHHFSRTKDLTRAQQMASLRNMYLHRLTTMDVEFAIVVDTDLEIGWSYDGIATTFGHDNWDVVGSNSIVYRSYLTLDGAVKRYSSYYDTWAFRELEGTECNRMRLKEEYPRSDSLIPCKSCFGGLAIYSAEALTSGRYGGEDCEHVVLHNAMRAHGFVNISVNPHQLTIYNEYDPLITCIVSMDDHINISDCEAINDFWLQTYVRRELLLVRTGQCNFIARLGMSDGKVTESVLFESLQRDDDSLLDKAVEFAAGSVVCMWDGADRHHPRRLEEQSSYLGLENADVCILDGTLLYCLDTRELFWLADKANVSERKGSEEPELQTLMAYRHVAARRKWTKQRIGRRTDNAILQALREVRVALPHTAGDAGAAWTTMRVVAEKTAVIAQLVARRAVSVKFLEENKHTFENVVSEYCLSPPVRVMGYDGFAYMC